MLNGMSVVRSLISVIGILIPWFGIMGDEGMTDIPKTVAVRSEIVAVVGAEVKVGEERVSRKMKWLIGFLSKEQLADRKSRLLSELRRASRADIIIDPQFEYCPKPLGGGSLILTGYPARYVNFRNLTSLQIDSLILTGKYNPNSALFFNIESPDSI